MHVQPINVQRTSARTKQKITDCAISTEGRHSAAVKGAQITLRKEVCVESTGQQHTSAVAKVVIKSR